MSELYHFGVKGMKWGIRRKRKEPMNKDYTNRNRVKDTLLYGHRASKRINRSMNKGMTYKKALRREKGRVVAKAAISGAALLANPVSKTVLKMGLDQAIRAYAHRSGSPAQEALKEIGNKIIIEGKLA